MGHGDVVTRNQKQQQNQVNSGLSDKVDSDEELIDNPVTFAFPQLVDEAASDLKNSASTISQFQTHIES